MSNVFVPKIKFDIKSVDKDLYNNTFEEIIDVEHLKPMRITSELSILKDDLRDRFPYAFFTWNSIKRKDRKEVRMGVIEIHKDSMFNDRGENLHELFNAINGFCEPFIDSIYESGNAFELIVISDRYFIILMDVLRFCGSEADGTDGVEDIRFGISDNGNKSHFGIDYGNTESASTTLLFTTTPKGEILYEEVW